MGLLETLKSLLGRGESRNDRPADEGGTTVTVEYEPDAETEAAVKGADVSGTDDAATDESPAAASGTAASTTADDGEESDAAAEDAAPDGPAVDAEAGDAEDAEPGSGEGASPPVEEITGIGPTYASRLEAAGIETVADLAAADVGTVAEAADTAESRASDWIEQARDR